MQIIIFVFIKFIKFIFFVILDLMFKNFNKILKTQNYSYVTSCGLHDSFRILFFQRDLVIVMILEHTQEIRMGSISL